MVLGHHRCNTTFQILYASTLQTAPHFCSLLSPTVADTIERKPRQRSVLPVTWNWAPAAILQTDVRIPRPMCCDVIRHHEDWGTIRSQTLRDSPLTSCKVSRRREGKMKTRHWTWERGDVIHVLLIRSNQWCNALLWLDTVWIPNTVDLNAFPCTKVAWIIVT